MSQDWQRFFGGGFSSDDLQFCPCEAHSQEQIEKQFQRAGFTSRREDQMLFINTLQRILDPWHDGMDSSLGPRDLKPATLGGQPAASHFNKKGTWLLYTVFRR